MILIAVVFMGVKKSCKINVWDPHIAGTTARNMANQPDTLQKISLVAVDTQIDTKRLPISFYSCVHLLVLSGYKWDFTFYNGVLSNYSKLA